MREDLKDKRVLVTGGAGFVGSNLVRRLVEMGAETHIIEKPGVSPWRLEDCTGKISIGYTDISDTEQTYTTIRSIDPEYVFHLAAYGVDYRDQDFHKSISINLNGTLNLFEAIKNTACKRFIHTGSCSEFGNISASRYKENEPIDPGNIYGITKAASVQLVKILSDQYQKPVVVIRPFSLYGPYEPEQRIVPYIIKKCAQGEKLNFTKGEQIRDYLFVEDLVSAYTASLFVEINDFFETFNIGSGNPITVKDLIFKIVDILDYDREKICLGALPYRENERMSLVADIGKVEKKMGWTPLVSLEDGLRKTIDWFHRRSESDEVSR